MLASQGYGSMYNHAPSPFQTLYGVTAPRPTTQSQWYGYQGMYPGSSNTYQLSPMHQPSGLNPEAAAFVPQAYQYHMNPYSKEGAIQSNFMVQSMYGNTHSPLPPRQSPLQVVPQRTNIPLSQPPSGRGRGNNFSFAANMNSNAARAIPPPKSIEEMRADLLQTLQQQGKSPEQSGYKASVPPTYNAKRDPRKR